MPQPSSPSQLSRIQQAPFDQTLADLVERFGVSYQLHGTQYLRIPLEALIPSQILPFEVHVNPDTPRHLPPKFIESKITNDSEWKAREIPILMELSRLLGHPSTTASELVRTRLWEFDDHQVVYSTYPIDGRHTLRIEIHDVLFERMKEKAAASAVRTDSILLENPHLNFVYESFHRWLEETLQPAPEAQTPVTASKNGSALQLATPQGLLTLATSAQASLILRDYGDREAVLGYILFVTLKNPVGTFPQFVEASFCTCSTENFEHLEAMSQSLAKFWGVPLRREVSVARY
jgi:hypothetical protein